MVKKTHTREKRKYGVGTHTKHISRIKGTQRKSRPKTFSTEEAAKKYAQENKIVKFELKKVKKNKRFQIVSLK